MTTSRRWKDSRSAVLDGSGNASVTISPQRPNTRYRITGVGVQGSSVLKPTAKVYEGKSDVSNFVSGTYDGTNDADNELDVELWPGEVLTVRWEGGTVGATVTAIFRGEEIVGVD